MFCRKKIYSEIEKIHHKTLKVIYGIDDSYNNLLSRSNYFSIHQRNLRFLVTEIMESISQIIPEFTWAFLKKKKLCYNLRKAPILNVIRTQATYYGTNAVHFRSSLVWNNLPGEIKSNNSVFKFTTKVKNRGNIDCECQICK